MEETKVEGKHRQTEYTIVRTNDAEYTEGTGFEYEFVLRLDGEDVVTAGEVEARGGEPPWTQALCQYAEAYIDGGMN